MAKMPKMPSTPKPPRPRATPMAPVIHSGPESAPGIDHLDKPMHGTVGTGKKSMARKCPTCGSSY